MMLRKTLIAVSSTALFAASASAVAAQTPSSPGQGPGPQGGGMALPRTADEVQPWADRLFVRLDANQDAAITGNELAVLSQGDVAARGGSRLRAMISQSDTSRDARVSSEELSDGAARMFARMDRNSDGRLADDEMPQPPARPAPVPMPMPSPEPMPMPTPEG